MGADGALTGDRLTPLQRRILEALAPVRPAFTLVGGAALAAVHLGHRQTRDIDLFWRERSELGELVDQVLLHLERAFHDVRIIQREGSFARIRVEDGGEVIVVDLVADPGASIEPDVSAEIGKGSILVAGRHDILVSKLCSLLSRSEIRDLEDVEALLSAGGDLKRALGDAPRVDGGFSTVTLAWVLRDLNVLRLCEAAGVPPGEAERLETFRQQLIEDLVRLSKPE